MSTYTDASLIVTPNAKKAGKLYALKGADLDVVRATTATYVGSDGLIKTALANEVRFDYTNGTCPSILVEPQRTNLLLRSEEFDNASWTKVRATITSNLTASPDGNLTADRISCNETSNNGCFIRQTTSLTTERTTSIFVKPNTAKYFQIHRDFGSGVVFDLINGTIKQSVGATGTITEYANGWYRCTATFSVSGLSLFIVGNASMTVTDWFSTINESLFIWGAQLEAGSNATSYIPTVASTVTRNADAISKTGIADLIGQTEGTIYWEGIASYGTAPYYNIFSILRNVDNSKGIYLGIKADGKIRIVSQTVNYEDTSVSIPLNQKSKIALRYKDNDWALYLNGVLVWSKVALVSSGTFDIVEEQYGGGYLSPNRASAHVLYKTALTNDELAVLTTL